MTDLSSVRFTLADNTLVIVRKVTNNKYDFELLLPSGSRKTFIWTCGISEFFADRKGNKDKMMIDAVNAFMIYP